MEQAHQYLAELDPIVWLPSQLWFGFLRRRVIEISNLQKKLHQLADRPPNYGIITSLLSHMLQHVGITPVVKDPNIIRALAEVHFNGVSRRFGCFFLHNLDPITGSLPDVQKTDPPGLLIALKGQMAPENPAEQGVGSTGTPSALAQTWRQIVRSLNPSENRYIPIDQFIWDPSWLIYSVAEGLFCRFTGEFWTLLTESAFIRLQHIPVTLMEAMQLWTLDSVKVRIQHQIKYQLIPSGDTLNGAVPGKNRNYLFATHRQRFFPEPGGRVNPASTWALLHRKGYIREYHRAIRSSSDGGSSLNTALDGIFMNLQILPYNPGQPDGTQPLWRCNHSEVKLLFNSTYLQLLDRTVKRPEGETRGQGSKRLLSVAQLDSLLRGSGLAIPQGRTARKSMAHRIGKSKNWRQPPQRQPRPRDTESSEGREGVELNEERGGKEVGRGGDESTPEVEQSGGESEGS